MKCTLLLSGVAALLSMSCSTSAEKENIDFATATSEKIFKLDPNSAESPKSEIKLSVLYVKGEGQKAKQINDTISRWLLQIKGVSMQQAVDSFANMRGNNYIKDFKELYLKDKAENAQPGTRVFCKQRLEPCDKCVVRIDSLQKINDYRQNIIYFLCVTWNSDKRQTCSTRNKCVDA